MSDTAPECADCGTKLERILYVRPLPHGSRNTAEQREPLCYECWKRAYKARLAEEGA